MFEVKEEKRGMQDFRKSRSHVEKKRHNESKQPAQHTIQKTIKKYIKYLPKRRAGHDLDAAAKVHGGRPAWTLGFLSAALSLAVMIAALQNAPYRNAPKCNKACRHGKFHEL